MGTSWQDLKDHMRNNGKYRVQYADTYPSEPTRGRVEYATLEDMRDAYHELHESVLKGNKIELVYPKGSKYGPDFVPSDSEDEDKDRRPKDDRDLDDKSPPRRERSPSYSPDRRDRTYSDDSFDAKRPPSPRKDEYDGDQRRDDDDDYDKTKENYVDNDDKEGSDNVNDRPNDQDNREKEGDRSEEEEITKPVEEEQG